MTDRVVNDDEKRAREVEIREFKRLHRPSTADLIEDWSRATNGHQPTIDRLIERTRIQAERRVHGEYQRAQRAMENAQRNMDLLRRAAPRIGKTKSA